MQVSGEQHIEAMSVTKRMVKQFKHDMHQLIYVHVRMLTGSAWGDWANYTASPLRA